MKQTTYKVLKGKSNRSLPNDTPFTVQNLSRRLNLKPSFLEYCLTRFFMTVEKDIAIETILNMAKSNYFYLDSELSDYPVNISLTFSSHARKSLYGVMENDTEPQ